MAQVCRSLADVVQFAITREEKAKEFYEQCEAASERKGLKKFFREMAGEEERHRRMLADLPWQELESATLEQEEDLHQSDFMVDVAFSPEMTYQQALVMAIKKEDKAERFYSAWKNRCGGEEVGRVFSFLAGEEQKHKEALEAAYEDLVD